MPDMDKNAPSDFTRAFHAVIADGLKNHVPLDFIVVNLEITKIDIANRFLNQQAAMPLRWPQDGLSAQALAERTADVTAPIQLDTVGKIIPQSLFEKKTPGIDNKPRN